MGVMERRKRRAFTKEFKAETVRLVVDGGLYKYGNSPTPGSPGDQLSSGRF